MSATLVDKQILLICTQNTYTGILAGKFLEQTQVAKPKDSELEPTVHYQAEDLYIGSRVQIYKHNFVLIDADEYALRYMEKHKEQVTQTSRSWDLSSCPFVERLPSFGSYFV